MGTDAERLKRDAAARALDFVSSGMKLGLGTGSTVAHFIELLAEALDSGRLTDVVALPTSVRTDREARQVGIPLVGFAEVDRLDLTVDGADEVTPELDMVKGMGGALLREKMVAQASDRLVIIADDRKLVERLGARSPLPVEVVDWGFYAHIRCMEGHGAAVKMRSYDDGPPFKSDNGNLILDCSFPDGIADARALDAELNARAGVVDHGLFLGMADSVVLAGADGIRVLGDAS